MRKAVGVLKELSADEQTRMLFEAREKARRDEASRTRGAIKDTRIEIAKNLFGLNMPIDTIIKATGLTESEIKSINHQ